ncbi:MAG TPA: DUF5693 family protein, partial [Synergistaceae bacterium]|nr:DUF5693 family protein [Synergistaceae bacterium]
PPLLVLLHDLRRRVHPESLGEILERPSLWGEFMLLAFAMGGMAFLALRSDNVSFVPQWEIMLRDSLEQILVARPRNKELFIGYPALALWYYVRRKDLWIRYREVFRVASVFAFASALNSFCHFHTPLYFTLFRVSTAFGRGFFSEGFAFLCWPFFCGFSAMERTSSFPEDSPFRFEGFFEKGFPQKRDKGVRVWLENGMFFSSDITVSAISGTNFWQRFS